MLTTDHVDHFRTFGFTVLHGYLADRVSALRAEVGAAIRDAYAASSEGGRGGGWGAIDGISGHYLPMASRLTPVSTSLVCDDPRLIDAAEQLLGGPVIPECPEGVLYFFEAGWHTDDGIGWPGRRSTSAARDRLRARPDAAIGARQLRAGVPRLRPGSLPRPAGLAR
jgi:hypothetical protein